MLRFVKTFVVPLLKGKRWQSVCEIGASLGDGTGLLASVPNARLTVIDPCYDCDLAEKFSNNPRVHVEKGTSLEVLPRLDKTFDCILLDGDHNWYTVYMELKVIREKKLLRPGGIMFFHDVEWPWGRRDMYYRPDLIPSEFVHEWNLQGIARGKREASEQFATHTTLKKAAIEGGLRNGVLTAIEDFAREQQGQYRFFVVHAGAGLAVMQYRGGMVDRLRYLLLWAKGFLCNIAIRGVRIVHPASPSLVGEV
jgi:predicted O-methyltransferase YrrM